MITRKTVLILIMDAIFPVSRIANLSFTYIPSKRRRSPPESSFMRSVTHSLIHHEEALQLTVLMWGLQLTAMKMSKAPPDVAIRYAAVLYCSYWGLVNSPTPLW